MPANNKFLALTQNKELSIVFLVLIVLCMLIIPLPTEVMDVLIMFNITVSIIVLMVVIYMDSPLKLTAFPSILLILAMLRIGITISTSRLILLDADAGKIVETFGNFVVSGSLVVGVVIFTMITIINFIVITKGSERVAEVAARFSLDAMPGKQMSIDSDLRSGTIDMEEANQRRKDLNLESKLYGAMDGAMKFVKGDAIASIIDILVNLVGGFIVGIVEHDMTLGKSISTYSILTIGDGLVQQIPTLLVSLTAGMMITKVSDESEQLNLGESVLKQVFSNRKAIIASSIMLIIMALVPGMPSVTIGVFFVILLIIIKLMQKKDKAEKVGKEQSIREEVYTENNISEDFTSWKLSPILLHVAANLKNGVYVNTIKQAALKVQQEILVNLGVELPQITIRYDSSLENNHYQILIYEIPTATTIIYPQHILIVEQQLKQLEGIIPTQTIVSNNTSLGMAENGVWVPESNIDVCEKYNLSYLTIEDFITKHVTYVLRLHVSEFLGMQEVKNLLTKIDEYQDLITELLRMISLNKITEMLQRLIAEDISIRNFKVILDTMLEWVQREKETIIITEQIRSALGRYIAYKFSKGSYTIQCFLLDQDIEDMIRDAIRFNHNGSYLALDPQIAEKIINSTLELYQKSNGQALSVTPVIVTHQDIRRYVRSIIEKRLNFIHVLSFQELEGHVEFNGLGVIQLGGY